VHTRAAGSHVSPDSRQSTHAAPAAPHAAESVPVTQKPSPFPVDWQHPLGHVAALQTLGVAHVRVETLHATMSVQTWQASPPMPHAALVVPASHVPVVSQHPAGHGCSPPHFAATVQAWVLVAQ